jgi:colicin import membrane protein
LKEEKEKLEKEKKEAQ